MPLPAHQGTRIPPVHRLSLPYPNSLSEDRNKYREQVPMAGEVRMLSPHMGRTQRQQVRRGPWGILQTGRWHYNIPFKKVKVFPSKNMMK